ncbi:hypothetical protein [Chthonobacter rhizosphaerae]|uniref:hypothetical protein n=1 Tax=Chthonobacter rhizosphaerae TaxID=2735553 RepID=UPI0015EF256A|nr:hypothetical protein [Chthonobacter rhizosphaerae]
MTKAYEVGQSVRLATPFAAAQGAGDVYTVLRRHEMDSDDPTYVIESEVDRRLRRESHSRLKPAAG